MLFIVSCYSFHSGKSDLLVFDELLPDVEAEVVEPLAEELEVVEPLADEEVEAEEETELDEAEEVDEAEDEDEEADPERVN